VAVGVTEVACLCKFPERYKKTVLTHTFCGLHSQATAGAVWGSLSLSRSMWYS